GLAVCTRDRDNSPAHPTTVEAAEPAERAQRVLDDVVVQRIRCVIGDAMHNRRGGPCVCRLLQVGVRVMVLADQRDEHLPLLERTRVRADSRVDRAVCISVGADAEGCADRRMRPGAHRAAPFAVSRSSCTIAASSNGTRSVPMTWYVS